MPAQQLFDFSEECASNWFKVLPKAEKDKFTSFVKKLNSAYNSSRVNGLPKQYIGAAKKIAKRCNADPAKLMDEQIFAMDQQIVKTQYAQNIYGQMVGNITSVLNNPRWIEKYYKIDEDAIYPAMDRDFKSIPVFTIGVEPATSTGYGMAMAYEIPWTQLAESRGGLYDPDYYYQMVLAERFGIMQDEIGWNGTAAPHCKVDVGYKGLFNHASVQTYTHSNSSTLWNNWKALLAALSKMKAVYQQGSLNWVLTSGAASDLYYQMTTTGNIDLEISMFRKYLSELGVKIWVTDRLYSAGVGNTTAIANSTQCSMICKLGPTLQKRSIIYPTQTKPMQDKRFASDIKEAMIYGENLVQYGVAVHPVAVDTQFSSTDTGFLPNGRLM
jgi:hypothetical protein